MAAGRNNLDCGDGIPRQCADEFQEIEHRLTRIEGKVDAIIDSRRSYAGKVWDIAKFVTAGIIGAIITHLTSGSSKWNH